MVIPIKHQHGRHATPALGLHNAFSRLGLDLCNTGLNVLSFVSDCGARLNCC
jgi:hypothetical protein